MQRDKNLLKFNRRKRGTTLVEVTTALALIAIATAMVVSFCSLTLSNVLYYKTYDRLRYEMSFLEKTINSYVNRYDSNDYSFSVSPDGKILYAVKDSENKFCFKVEDKTLICEYDNNESEKGTLNYKFDCIDGVAFSLADEKDGTLIEFIFHYILNDGKDGTFSVYKFKHSIGGNA